MKRWNKGNITLQIRVPPIVAKSLLGRLYGSGFLSREQYYRKIRDVDLEYANMETKKAQKIVKMFEKIIENKS